LLRAAHGVAVGRVELTHTVVSAAQKMVAANLIEASDELADALGLFVGRIRRVQNRWLSGQGGSCGI